jgi:hypothetical protein
MLPRLAQGEANKIFIIPSEFSQALGNIGGAIGNAVRPPAPPPPPPAGARDPHAGDPKP